MSCRPTWEFSIGKNAGERMNQNPHLPGTPDEFIQKNMGLAQYVAQRFIKRRPQRADDILNIAYLGLVEAYKNFDPSKVEGGQIKFSTYGVAIIQGTLMRHLRDFYNPIHIPRPFKDLVNKMWNADLSGDEPLEEIATTLGISLEEAKSAVEVARTLNIDSLDREINTEEGNGKLKDVIGEEDEGVQEKIILDDFANRLKPTLKQVYQLCVVKELNQREAARVMGISQSYICRLLPKLYKMGEQYGRDEVQPKRKEPPVVKYPKEFKDRLTDLSLTNKRMPEIKKILRYEFPQISITDGSLSGFISSYRKEAKKPVEEEKVY